MAYIPEEIMVQFKFESGFNKTFKPLMDAYKERKGPSSKGSESNHEASKDSGPKNKSQNSSSLSGNRTKEVQFAIEESDEDDFSPLLKKDK
jgi:hypothetical protein